MLQEIKKIRVGITLGDTAGIGPEIILKTFNDDRIFKHFTPIVFGNPRIFSFYKKIVSAEKFQYTNIRNFSQLNQNTVNVVPVWDEEFAITPGTCTKITGNYAFKSLKAACEALKNNDIDVLVTAPINKNFIQSEQFNFAGHTEYLQDFFGAKDNLMFMVADNIKVGLVTNHTAIKKVSEQISKDKIIRKLILMNTSLKEDFGIDTPKIAVLGLNPHAGDNGLIGKEDIEIILPAINDAKNEKIYAFGPFPADGFFANKSYQNFDAVLAMYHDQGLIPFKFLSDDGTNFTAGLNIIRTSPDHGTAEDIAGKDIADETSFRNAIFKAIDIFRSRTNFFENRSNPLQKLAKLEDER